MIRTNNTLRYIGFNNVLVVLQIQLQVIFPPKS